MMNPLKHNKLYSEKGEYRPQRMCISCRSIVDKSKLLRAARFADGTVKICESGGRGAYVCKNKACIEKLVKSNGFARGLKTAVPHNIYEECCADE